VSTDLAHYAADAQLRDGCAIHIRAIRPDDKHRLQAHFQALSFDSIRFRFLGAKKDLTPQDLRYFTELDFSNHVGVVAVRRHDGDEEFIGVARYICAEDDHRRAEFAVAVVDTWQGRGVGTVLIDHLARIAAADGVERFEADILATNRKMFDVVRGLGFRADGSLRAGVVHTWFPIGPAPGP
jgi:RimJ/RimL family protein N-acetyltransferase